MKLNEAIKQQKENLENLKNSKKYKNEEINECKNLLTEISKESKTGKYNFLSVAKIFTEINNEQKRLIFKNKILDEKVFNTMKKREANPLMLKTLKQNKSKLNSLKITILNNLIPEFLNDEKVEEAMRKNLDFSKMKNIEEETIFIMQKIYSGFVTNEKIKKLLKKIQNS